MISIENAKLYYNKKTRPALNIENLTFGEGEVTALLGENGAGKTTLLKALMGILPLNSGRIRIDGEHIRRKLCHLAFITEEGSLFGFARPTEMGKFVEKFYDSFNYKKYELLLDFFEIEDKKINDMSRGQQAKVEIALGFSKGAKYILMDEPFLNKDIFTRHDFLKLMTSSLRENETIVISTHQLDEIEGYIDRAVVLYRGEFRGEITETKGKSLKDELARILCYDEQKLVRAMKDMA